METPPGQCQWDRELVILVGMQGCGKTTYCHESLSGHARLSQDEGPRRFEGIVAALRKMVERGEPRIVIDRTNPLLHQRQVFTDLARQAGYRARIIYFDIPAEECIRRIEARTDHPTLDPASMHYAIARYREHLTVPDASECDEVVVIRG